PEATGAVTAVRTGKLPRNGLRLVFEVNGPVSFQVASVKPSSESGHRLVRDIIIAVDAGHGGVDPGASGRRGTREKDVVLEVAKALAARIDREPGMKA